MKVVDLSADFRLADTAAYARWYGDAHHAPELQSEAVYGLVEIHRDKIKASRLVANPGCYTTCAQLPLVPLIRAKAIDLDEIVVDAKSGMTGAGRAARENMLFSEVSEGFHAYGVGHHRHMAELDQEFSAAAGREVTVTFTPHLVPMNRGILSTIYVRGLAGRSPQDLHGILADAYAGEPFVHVLPFGEMPQTRHVRGSNMTFIGVAADRVAPPRHHRVGARQPGQGRRRPGGAEHEPGAGLSRDHGARAGRAVSVNRSLSLRRRGSGEPESTASHLGQWIPGSREGRRAPWNDMPRLNCAPSRSSPARPRSARPRRRRARGPVPPRCPAP